VDFCSRRQTSLLVEATVIFPSTISNRAPFRALSGPASGSSFSPAVRYLRDTSEGDSCTASDARSDEGALVRHKSAHDCRS